MRYPVYHLFPAEREKDEPVCGKLVGQDTKDRRLLLAAAAAVTIWTFCYWFWLSFFIIEGERRRKEQKTRKIIQVKKNLTEIFYCNMVSLFVLEKGGTHCLLRMQFEARRAAVPAHRPFHSIRTRRVVFRPIIGGSPTVVFCETSFSPKVVSSLFRSVIRDVRRLREEKVEGRPLQKQSRPMCFVFGLESTFFSLKI